MITKSMNTQNTPNPATRSFEPAPRCSRLPAPLATWLEKASAVAAQAKAQGIQPTPALARQSLADMTRQLAGQGPDIALIRDFRLEACPDVPLRLYDPAPEKSLPGLVYIHGGGHMAGSVDVYDPIIRRVALYTGCRTVAIDYRLAPEHPYPQGLNDCFEVIQALTGWWQEHGGGGEQGVILVGDSGGGALTASLSALAVKEQSMKIRGQILVYPSLDYTLSQPSVQTNGQGYLLDTERIRWYFENYFQNNEDRRRASPLFMSATGLPATLIFTAGFCPLRDEGYMYAQNLMQAGASCHHVNLPDMIHAYLNIQSLVPLSCEQTYKTMGRWIKSL